MTATDFRSEKNLVLAANAAIDAAGPNDTAAVLQQWTDSEYRWRGVYPFNEQAGQEAVAGVFWSPLKSAFGQLQRRPDIFMAGLNSIDGGSSKWVVEMGHLMGLWDEDWIDLPATGKIAFLRYVEFHRIESEKIAESAVYVDILNLIEQSGTRYFPLQTGTSILTPGPRTQDGLLFDPQDPVDGKATLDLIEAMIVDLRGNRVHSPTGHMEQFWHPDMCWFGPGGIGASAFFGGYRRGHCQPFEDGLEYVRHTEHKCRIGEGRYGGFFGYPSLTMKCTGGFLGMPATNVAADMRIVDLYRREGDRLAENWIFIDLPYFFAQQGLDILKTIRNA